MNQLIRKERTSDRIAEQIIDVAIPEIREQIVGVGEVIPEERVQQHTGDHVVDQLIDSPISQVREFNVEVASNSAQVNKLETCPSMLTCKVHCTEMCRDMEEVNRLPSHRSRKTVVRQ